MYKFFLLVVVALVSTGCGQAENSPAGPAASGNPVTGQGQTPESGSIAQVAQTFLGAIRSGQSDVATAQLTQLAQQRTREADLDFTLMANQQASFQVESVEKLEADEAIVETVWTEPDANGSPLSEKWTIALRLDQGQWRILGIVSQSGADQMTDVMDFENPGQQFAAPATAAAPAPNNTVPQQATRPVTQDPFRQ